MTSGLLASDALLAAVSTASAAEFNVVQDTSSKRCSIVEQRPSGDRMAVVTGTVVYPSRTDAEAAMKTASICKATAANQAPATTTTGRGVATGEVRLLTQAPAGAVSITKLYKQSVYDSNNARVGEIDDVLMTSNGEVAGLVIGVGGFLGIGEKYVLIPFSSINQTERDGSVKLMLNTTKEALNSAPGFKYERSKYVWVAADRNSQAVPPRK
jgi:sporulation protein YlmC with PRC-barrel domain